MAGSHALEFEREFAAYQGAEYCLALNSGTSALEIGLLATGIQPGDEVILSPYTYIASAAAILMAGGVPIFVDMDPDTYNVDPSKIESAITDRTAAIMPVHFAGMACDMHSILEIAAKHRLKIVEDAAHAHGARWNNVGLGTIGDVGAFSFQSSKNLNSGEGGVILTNNREIFAGAIHFHDAWTGGLAERDGDAGGRQLQGRAQVGLSLCLPQLSDHFLRCGAARVAAEESGGSDAHPGRERQASHRPDRPHERTAKSPPRRLRDTRLSPPLHF